jgi:SAM-dependent methyltransferase
VDDPGRQAPAAAAWRASLEALAIPPEILAKAPADPWQLPPELFLADVGAQAPPTPSRQRAVEVLPPRGSVLDVGCGGGRASLALVPPAARLTGVDESSAMLAEFSRAAGAAGLAAVAIHGHWPDVAVSVPVEPADVVVCHHVAYNVADLVPFVVALTGSARRRVVLELTDRHPRAGLAGLWEEIWGITRTDGPEAADAAAVLREAGLDVAIEAFTLPSRPGRGREAVVATVRRHLCVGPERDGEIDRLLPTDFGLGPRAVTCMWWPGESAS